MDFRKWLKTNEAVAFAATSRASAGLKYKPGTFGVEIEMQVEEGDGDKNYDSESPAVLQKIKDIIRFLKSIGQKAIDDDATPTEWGISEDSKGVVEVRTPHMTTQDMPALVSVLNYLRNENFNGGTSAHVHIGMPKDTNAFDLLAMATLADEKSIHADAGANRNFGAFAKSNTQLHSMIQKVLMKVGGDSGWIDEADVMEQMQSLTDRHFGTNLLTFFRLGTVEFRYLSSQIVSAPERFVEWVNYYLMLPGIARGRNQIVLKGAQGDPLVLNRAGGGKIRVSKGTSAPQIGLPAKELRGPAKTWTPYHPEESWAARIEQLLLKRFGPKTIMDLDRRFRRMSWEANTIIQNAIDKNKRRFGSDRAKIVFQNIWPSISLKERLELIKEFQSLALLPMKPGEKLNV